jgi:hypothetical protein
MSSARQAWTSVVLGALALAAIPVAALLAGRVVSVDLVRALSIAVGAAVVLGLAGISASRRARFRVERSLARRWERTARVGRFLVLAGLYVALVAGLALGFYGLVQAFS